MVRSRAPEKTAALSNVGGGFCYSTFGRSGQCARQRSCQLTIARFGQSAISSPLMQHALFGLFTAIFALKRPYLALDLWVKRSAHEIGPAPTVRASNRLRGWPNIRG